MLSCRTLDSALALRSHTGSYGAIILDGYEIEDHHSGTDDYETGALNSGRTSNLTSQICYDGYDFESGIDDYQNEIEHCERGDNDQIQDGLLLRPLKRVTNGFHQRGLPCGLQVYFFCDYFRDPLKIDHHSHLVP